MDCFPEETDIFFFFQLAMNSEWLGVTSVEPNFRAEQLAFLYGEGKRT